MSEPTAKRQKPRHPGAGRRAGRLGPKGRQIDDRARDEVRTLLADRPRRRDLLIEFLHLIQDRYHHLSSAHLAALADEMKLAEVEVYEVASFYAHFDIVKEGETPPPALTVRVCDSLTCAMFGGEAMLDALRAEHGAAVRVVRAPCMGRCDRAPVAAVGQNPIDRATVESVGAAVRANKTSPEIPLHQVLDVYRARGGYALLEACRSGERSADAVIEALSASGLKGLGGAGFPAGQKWRLVRGAAAPRVVAVNADEGEPGTFKDRFILENETHRFLEGMLIAAWAVGADEIYIYLRDEYPELREVLRRELAALERAGLTGDLSIHLRRGAGAYICGEESAMLESLEGRRGEPRHKPPFPAEVGLFGRPTLIHNVETLYWIRDILAHGPEWFAGQGRSGATGLRLFSVSGRVYEPGVKRAPAGVTAYDLIDEYCGGMIDDQPLKAYLPGGASGGLLPARLANLPLDFGSLDDHGCFVGSGAVILLGEQDDIKDVVLNLMRFFEDESCGQCTPCRVGCEKAVKLLEAGQWDESLLRALAAAMVDASICGLGQAAPNPLLCALEYFRDELPL